MADEPQAQPVEGQGQPPAPAPAASAAPTTAPAGDGPWANDLATLFEDATIRSTVDGFLRSKVQPYTTKLEQEAAQAKDAMRLWQDLEANPIDTYVAMTTEMFGEEAGQNLLNQLQQQLAATPDQQQPPQQQAPPAPEAQQLDPRFQEMLDYYENEKNEKYYEGEIKRVITEHPEVDAELLHPFVAAAEGNFDYAYELYQSFLNTYGEKYGNIAPPTPPPAVLGSDTGTVQPSATPVEPKKQTMSEAIDDFMAENRANRQAPPVGAA